MSSPSLKVDIELVATAVVDSCLSVHRELGAGLLESVYQKCLTHELRARDHQVACEVPVAINYMGSLLDMGFRLDMIVDDMVLIENKSVQSMLPVHQAQLLTYLKLSGYRLGFLINWNVPLIREGMVRMVHRL